MYWVERIPHHIKKKYNMKKVIYETHKIGTNKNDNRSSKRTDILHKGIVEGIKKLVPNFDNKYYIKYESKVDCFYGNKFDVDILLFDKKTNESVIAILVKGIISSYNKNKYNYANCTSGEMIRILGKNPNMKIFFVSILPNEIPLFFGSGEFKSMEIPKTVNFAELDFSNFGILNDNVFHSKINYNVVGVNYSTKDKLHKSLNMKNIKNVNLKSFTECVNKIFLK
jgi:hypothetical protein